MSRYLFVYVALVFFATSLAVANESSHTEGGKPSEKRPVAADTTTMTEDRTDIDNGEGRLLTDTLEKVEENLGKRRKIGEFVERSPNLVP